MDCEVLTCDTRLAASVDRLLDAIVSAEADQLDAAAIVGPRRFRFLLGHRRCCLARGKAAGWCSEPERYDVPIRGKRIEPEPAEIERAVVRATVDQALASLADIERLAAECWGVVCLVAGYPPLDNDRAKRQAWAGRANPVWQQLARDHGVATDYAGDRSRTRVLRDALDSACQRLARATGWLPDNERKHPT